LRGAKSLSFAQVAPLHRPAGLESCGVREADDFETLAYQTSAALNEYRNAHVTTLIEQKADTLTFTWNKRGAKLNLCELK